jgi:Ser/Thr protein kinase RdoA (MazF antagonist)
LDNAIAAAEQFAPAGSTVAVQEYGSGNVNDTYLVTVGATMPEMFILQRINTHVFPHPDWIMLNMRAFCEHVEERLDEEQTRSGRRWEVPAVLRARDGQDFFLDKEGSFWRATSFIGSSQTYETVQDSNHAREAGYALGRFHSLISDLDTASLLDTLVGFHITPRYLQHYDEVLDGCGTDKKSDAVRFGKSFVAERRDWASVLEDAKARGELVLRPIHGDPKVNNIMIDHETREAVSIVDLDTVKPGLVHYDIGDCLRSCCNREGEETKNLEAVEFDAGLCTAILEGYLSVANGFLSKNDYSYLYDAIRLISFELGLRFFTDYLEGNVYFRALDREHNLRRALVQFKLTESIEDQESEIRAIIRDLT